jgi:hypothetical protein
MLTVLEGLAEFERELIRAARAKGVTVPRRTAAGLAASRRSLNSRHEMPKSVAANIAENRVGDCGVELRSIRTKAA